MNKEVPPFPKNLENTGAHDLSNLWEHHFRVQKSSKKGRTIVTASMINMVPMDAPHPLYDDEAWSTALRAEFINDAIVEETVDQDDPLLASGLVVKNRNGKELKFTRPVCAGGPTMVNGVKVMNVETLADGTVIYTLDEHLFNWRPRVDEAFKKMMASQKGQQGCFRGCGGPPF